MSSSKFKSHHRSRHSRYFPRLSSSEFHAKRDESPPLLEHFRDDPLRPPTRIEIEDDGDGDLESPSAPCCRICLEGGSQRHVLISPCLCKGTQQFVHRSCLDHWRSVKEGFAFSHCTTCKAQFHLRVEKLNHLCQKIKFHFFVGRDFMFLFLIIQMVIAIFGSLAYLLDRNGALRNLFGGDWELILSKHPIPFYYFIGVVVFLVGMGIYGILSQCSSVGTSNIGNRHHEIGNERREISNVQFETQDHVFCCCCCIGNDRETCNSDSSKCCSGATEREEASIVILVVVVVILAIIGIFYLLYAATITIQHIWQKHYHILAKRELTKEYVVEDLHGCYSPPKLAQEHEDHLKFLKLL